LKLKSQINFSLVCRWAFPFVQGGIPMHNINLLKSLKNIINSNIISENNNQNVEYYRNVGIPLIGFYPAHKYLYGLLVRFGILNNGLRSISDWYYSFIINKEISKIPVDIIEFIDIHSEGYLFLKKNIKGRRKSKVVIRSHTPWTILRNYYNYEEKKSTDGWWAMERERFCFNQCDSISTPSLDLKKQLMKEFDISDKKITVLPNIVDTHHFSPRDYNKNDSFTILHVGRFEKGKGVETLIDAFIMLSKKYQNIRLLNIGPEQGNFLNKCINRLRKNNLLEKVTFEGFIKYEKLPEKYGNADIVVVPSEIYESFSYTVAQAMACGRAVIASNIGGIPETIGYGRFGLTFSPGNIEELYKKINELYEDKVKRERLGDDARYFALKNFSIEALSLKYFEYYSSLIN